MHASFTTTNILTRKEPYGRRHFSFQPLSLLRKALSTLLSGCRKLGQPLAKNTIRWHSALQPLADMAGQPLSKNTDPNHSFIRVYTSYMYICPRTFYFEYFLREEAIHFIRLFYNIPIWLFWNVYVVADNDVTVLGRALHYNATLSLATSFFAICIISNSAWYSARILQVLYNSFILVLLQLCGALNNALQSEHVSGAERAKKPLHAPA